MHPRILRLVIPCLLGLALVAGCRHSASTDGTIASATAGPVNEKERYQAEQWAKATEGLRFQTDSGLVEVDRIYAGDAFAALEQLALGDESLDLNRILDAIEHYGRAVRHDPDLSQGYIGLGVVLERKGKLDEAMAAFRTALDRDPANLEARFQLAMALWSASRMDEAIATMDEVVSADDRMGKAHVRLALWHYYTGDYTSSWRHLRRAEALGHTAPAQFVSQLQQKMPESEAGTR